MTASLREFKRGTPLKVAIIGAMEEEVELLRSQLEDRQTETHVGYEFSSGKLNGVEVVLLKSGIGKVNAALSTTLLLERYQPDCVINTGSAGGFDAALNVGDVVISTAVYHHDVDVTVFGYAPGQVPGLPAQFLPDELLSEVAQSAIPHVSAQEQQIVQGEIATGDAFMNDPVRVEAVRSIFPTMKAVEMEAAAIAQVCHQFAKPFLIIRSLSDIAGKESNVSFDQYLPKAAKHSAAMVTAVTAALGKTLG
ncbi:5'-methylthioadenosine/S-adenosylhomocysteine nucleosidase [Pokkaliibacter sp. CJK22405]|uniref:5'-methylthioadenosine/S-adenosylhomocysteine nucleosidase n=1 Tax=Pokkaliibacter sp. CJK22405 TaxID=3384615 RepID=UPI003985225B